MLTFVVHLGCVRRPAWKAHDLREQNRRCRVTAILWGRAGWRPATQQSMLRVHMCPTSWSAPLGEPLPPCSRALRPEVATNAKQKNKLFLSLHFPYIRQTPSDRNVPKKDRPKKRMVSTQTHTYFGPYRTPLPVSHRVLCNMWHV